MIWLKKIILFFLILYIYEYINILIHQNDVVNVHDIQKFNSNHFQFIKNIFVIYLVSESINFLVDLDRFVSRSEMESIKYKMEFKTQVNEIFANINFYFKRDTQNKTIMTVSLDNCSADFVHIDLSSFNTKNVLLYKNGDQNSNFSFISGYSIF